MKILVINLTRMGDLLQSTPLLKGLKEKYPGCEITLMANSKFAPICERIPFVDHLYKFDTESIAKAITEESEILFDVFKRLEEIITSLNSAHYEKVINLTHSKMSAFLTSLLNCKDKNGITIDSKGFRVIKNDWMVYFFNAAINRNFNPFNLVDMYLLTEGIKNRDHSLIIEKRDEDIYCATEFYNSNNVNENDILIGFQPGASKSHKQWPIEYFAKLASILSKKQNVRIVVFGTSSETPLARKIAELSGKNIIDATGKTTMQNLAAFIAKCSILVTNDTGTMHIATAAGVPVIELSLGPVNFIETGPYGRNNIVIQTTAECAPCSFSVSCKNEICKKTIQPEDVVLSLEVLLGEKNICELKHREYFKNSNVFLTVFDDDGFLDSISPKKITLTKTAFWREIYRTFWKKIYNNILNENTKSASVLSFFEKYSPPSDNSIVKNALNVANDMGKIETLSEEGEDIVKQIINSLSAEKIVNTQSIGEKAKKITAIDEEIYFLSGITEELLPICDIYRMKRESIDSEDVKAVSWKCLSLFRELRNNCITMKNLLREAVNSDFFDDKKTQIQTST